jgi:predicted ATPase
MSEHAARLLTKEELLREVWPDTAVSDSALAVCIRELRKALGDDAARPEWIETVHRRGYRFIRPLTPASHQARAEPSVTEPRWSAPVLVGRARELAQLEEWREDALRGERRIVFISGEPGIGKTTLVDAFLARISSRRDAWLARGQCIEHFGAGEAYLPVLAALGELCREADGERLVGLLERHAPTWLAQMPALLAPAAHEALVRRTLGTTRERMLREIAEALEASTAEQPLALALEDLHWGDASTLDLLNFLARRRQRARLLVLCTYRPVEVILREHPLKRVKQELQLHGHCEEIALGHLDEPSVGDYLAARLGASAESLRELARSIHRRTEGNPLFMVNVVNDLIAHGAIAEERDRWIVKREAAQVVAAVPESLRKMIEGLIDRLSADDQQLLEVGSVAGAEFSAAAAAAGAQREVGEIEGRCERLAQRTQLLRACGTEEWPDGTAAARYGFTHAAYREVTYERVPPARRAWLHQQIGERLESAYQDRCAEVAAELAAHFERGRDARRAVVYLRQAAEAAARRSAHHEAIGHLGRAIELLGTLPDDAARAEQELMVNVTLGRSLAPTQGLASPDVGRVFNRALELCGRVGTISQLFPSLAGLWTFCFLRGDWAKVRAIGKQLLDLAERENDPDLLLEVHYGLQGICFHSGDFVSARAHLERAVAPRPLRDAVGRCFSLNLDAACGALAYAAWNLVYLGYAAQAVEASHQALELARRSGRKYEEAFALMFGAWVHLHRRDPQATRELAEAALAIGVDQGFAQPLVQAKISGGWALSELGEAEEGIARMREGAIAWRAAGNELGLAFFWTLLAGACLKAGRVEEGLDAVDEALAAVGRTAEEHHQAELHRLQGELALARAGDPESRAEDEFQQALAVARRQQAKSLELRAAMSLSRLWQRQARHQQALELLEPIYGWFQEGFDTADLREAKALLGSLRSQARLGAAR